MLLEIIEMDMSLVLPTIGICGVAWFSSFIRLVRFFCVSCFILYYHLER